MRNKWSQERYNPRWVVICTDAFISGRHTNMVVPHEYTSQHARDEGNEIHEWGGGCRSMSAAKSELGRSSIMESINVYLKSVLPAKQYCPRSVIRSICHALKFESESL